MKRLLPVAVLLALVALALAVVVSRVSRITVTGDGDYALTATQDGRTITLQPGAVTSLHPSEDSSAGNHRITNVFPGVGTNDGLVFGQPVQSDSLTGQLPYLYLRDPIKNGQVNFGPLTLNGSCAEGATTIWGARAGMVATASVTSTALATLPVKPVAYVQGNDVAVVRLCSPTEAVLPATSYRVAVIP